MSQHTCNCHNQQLGDILPDLANLKLPGLKDINQNTLLLGAGALLAGWLAFSLLSGSPTRRGRAEAALAKADYVRRMAETTGRFVRV